MSEQSAFRQDVYKRQRWVSVNRLTVRPTDTVWDVGAGTGAVTLELARKASDGTVYAVERKPEAVALLHENQMCIRDSSELDLQSALIFDTIILSE